MNGHRRFTLPLLLEWKNASKRRLSPALRMTSRLKAEATDGEGKPLRVADLIEVTPWEQRGTANTLPAGASIRWTIWFDRLGFIDRPAAGSKVRLRFQLEDRSLPGRVDSNWVELTMRDAPPLVSGQGDFPGVWAQFVDFVYREPTGAGYHALHVDGEGHADLIAYSAGEDPWYGRHSATMSRKRLDFLADVLKRQEAWKLVGLKPKAARPEDPHVEFAYVAAGSLLRCRFPMDQVKEEPALLAIHRAAEFLMACVVQDARAADGDWGPLSGDEDDGLQCRLRAAKDVWQPGEIPTFEADVRNVGMRDLLAARSEVVFEVEVDGKWCRYTASSSAKSSPLPPGREYDGIAIALGSHWREKTTLQPIPWGPGKHTVRVAYVAWAGEDDGPPAHAKSNPVTIAVAGEQTKDESQANPWVVTGKVTDQSGKGLPGVTVRANCGWGTLRPTGETTTANDGTYSLRFAPGMHVLDEKTKQWRAGVQAANVYPSKPGYYERNLHRQGDLLMADEMPDEKGLRVWSARPERIVVPEKPYRVDFVMAPAASIEVYVLEEKRRAPADAELWIAGNILPPASSVLASGRTDNTGKWTFDEVPLEYAWSLVVRQPGNPRGEVRTQPIVFRESGQYRILLHGDPGTTGPWSPTFLRVPVRGNADLRGEAVLVDPARTLMAALTSAEVKLPLMSLTHYAFSVRVRRILSERSFVTFDKDGNVTAMSLCEPWIDYRVVREFQVLPKLEELSLGGRVEIDDIGLACLGKLAELKSLTVPGNKVTDKGLTYLANLNKLESLYLWSDRITDEGLAHLLNLKKLDSLYLWSDRITDEGLQSVSRIQGLKNLGFLGGAHITEGGLQHLAGMKQLKSLRLDYATVPWAAIDRLKQALPGCKVDVTRPD